MNVSLRRCVVHLSTKKILKPIVDAPGRLRPCALATRFDSGSAAFFQESQIHSGSDAPLSPLSDPTALLLYSLMAIGHSEELTSRS